jgi:hypothetical protein
MSTKLEIAAASKSKLNDNLNYQPLKAIFELITNIPKIGNEILWKFNKDKEGLRLTFRQDVGTTIEKVQDGLATDKKIETEQHFTDKNGDHGGLFGTGLSLVRQYSLEMQFRTNGEQWDCTTDKVTSYDIDSNVVEIEILLPISSYKQKYIIDAKELIGKTDFFRHVDKRNHKFLVEGFNPNDNTLLSQPLEKEKLVWKNSVGQEKDIYDYDKVPDSSGNPILEDIIPIELSRGKFGDELHNVRLRDFQIGKLKFVPKCWGVNDTNKPFLVLISEEADQVVGVLPWTGSHPVSTNNSVILAKVSKVDLRWLFGTADKMEGFHSTAEQAFVQWMKNVLNQFYPDSDTLESGGQFWAKDIIVKDKLGPKPSADFRESIGLGWMTKLTIPEREKLVYLEWSAGKDRFDFYIWVAKDGKVTSTTKKIIGESKRKGYDDNAFNQLNRYMSSESKVIGGIGFSCNISETHITGFDKITTKIKGAGQYKTTPEFYLCDLLDWGFANYMNEYTKLAMIKTKEAKEKAKLESQNAKNIE